MPIVPAIVAPARRGFAVLYTAFAATAIVGCASAPKQAPVVTQGDFNAVTHYVDERIGEEMARWNVKGVSVAIVDDQRVLLAKGYGSGDAAHNVAAGPGTLYRAGSLSKLLTATDVLRRAERGEIRLDDTLVAQLPGFAIHDRFVGDRPITVRSMLASHSGLPADLFKGMWLPQPGSLESLQHALADEYLANPPQTQFRYSNLDYSLLGRLIEVSSGKPFAEAISQDLLQPLGMSQTFFERTAKVPVAAARPYRDGHDAVDVGLRDDSAGAVLTSANDMAAFMRFLFAGGRVDSRPVVSAATLKSMFTPQYPDLPLDFGHRVGLGWMLSGVDVPGATSVAWHTGDYPGYSSAIVVLPEQKLGVVILANDERAKKFALEASAQILAVALEARTGEHHAATPAPAQPARVTLPQERLDALSGSYVIFGDLSKITRSGEQLSTRLSGTQIDLVPTSDHTFVPQKSVLGLMNISLGTLWLDFGDVGARRFAVLRGIPMPIPFERITPTALPDAWRQRLGTYATDDSDFGMSFDKLELAVEDGVLVARTSVSSAAWGSTGEQAVVALQPLTANEAVLAGAEGESGSVLAARGRNGQDGLRYSGYFFHRVPATH